MAALPMVALVTAGFVGWRFTTSQKQRGIDRRHRAAFVGFSAALVAVSAMTLGLIVGALIHARVLKRQGPCSLQDHRNHLVSRHRFRWFVQTGGQRIALLSFCVGLFLIFLFNFNAAGHFGTSRSLQAII
jgi:hypothetical protein